MTRLKSPRTLAILTLIVLTLLFFWKILLTNLILVGVDSFLYFYPYKAYASEALRQGRLPLWNPHLFMGAPLLANSQVGLFYPLNWPLIWLDAPRQVAWSIGLHIGLAGVLMLSLARSGLQLSWSSATIAAILFAFGGYLGAQVEHINQFNAAAWLPLLFLLYDAGLGRSPRWFWFLWLALVIALMLLAGHAQTVFISLFGLGLYALVQAISAAQNLPTQPHEPSRPASIFAIRRFVHSLFHHLWPLAVASILAVALAAIQLVPTAELSALSTRSGGLSYREAVAFSLRPTILHYTLLPPFGLDLSQVLGEAFGEWVAYLGFSGLLLALLGGLRSIWQREIRPFVFVAVSGLSLSLGLFTGPLYLALYGLVPGFDLFRVPARWLLLYAFGAAVLAGYGFEALLTPMILRRQLETTRRWLRARHWRLALFAGVPLVGLVALVVWKTPPVSRLSAWLGMALIAGLVIAWCVARVPFVRRTKHQALRHRFRFIVRNNFPLPTLTLLLLTELFWAAQTLNYNAPTAPQAYHSMRNAIAFLLAADPPQSNAGSPPGRFLSLSGITYDPGDLAELRQLFGQALSTKALEKLIVATKEKEVLFFNLPLRYHLHSVDGYDGGILPLAQFVTWQQLFLPPDSLSVDGRLRENLRFVPSGWLLSLLNTRWIITDKQFDVWIDDIFYDLQFPARLTPGQSIATDAIPDFPATALGLVSHLDGAASLPEGTPVAEVMVRFDDGRQDVLTLTAGTDTAEGNYPVDAAHPQATIGVTWPYEAAGVDYIAVYPLSRQGAITHMSVTATLPQGQFVLRGVSLIHQPTTTSRSILLSTEGDYRQVHSGDVKIYENLAVLPRAFVVHRADVVLNEAAALATMREPQFDPAATLVRLPRAVEPRGRLTRGQPSANDQVRITLYEPERVELATRLDSPGWLILTDTYYPGWQATVSGQATEIMQVDLLFRAIAVPEGKQTVVFEFKPRSLQMGAWLTGIAGVVLVAGLIVMNKKGR
jgi:hypothetical protein